MHDDDDVFDEIFDGISDGIVELIELAERPIGKIILLGVVAILAIILFLI